MIDDHGISHLPCFEQHACANLNAVFSVIDGNFIEMCDRGSGCCLFTVCEGDPVWSCLEIACRL